MSDAAAYDHQMSLTFTPTRRTPKLEDHEPMLRFKWLGKFARGGGAWCFRFEGRGYGPYDTKEECLEDFRGVQRDRRRDSQGISPTTERGKQ